MVTVQKQNYKVDTPWHGFTVAFCLPPIWYMNISKQIIPVFSVQNHMNNNCLSYPLFLSNKLLRWLILWFHEMSKPGDWYNSQIALKYDGRISSTTAHWHVQFQSDRSINIAASILKILEANCLQTATAPRGGTEKWLQGPFPRTRRGHPPPPRLRPASVPL